MERLKSSDSANEGKRLRVDVVRHGPSSYTQPDWRDVATASDLSTLGRYEEGTKSDAEVTEGKEMAVAAVRSTAEKIAESIQSDEEVIIWASPTGRTLETARIISEVLKERGVALRKGGDASEFGIKIFEQFGEVRNFSWDLFAPLMLGGEVALGESVFSIDKRNSNPAGLGYPEYFTSDAIREIPQSVKNQWPHEYVEKIEQFESFAEVTRRMADGLRRLKMLKDKHYRIILVTHDALTGAMVKSFTNGERGGLNPADFLSLERRGDKLVVTRVGDITEGNNSQDITELS